MKSSSNYDSVFNDCFSIQNKEIKHLKLVYFNIKTREECDQRASLTEFVYKLTQLPKVTK